MKFTKPLVNALAHQRHLIFYYDIAEKVVDRKFLAADIGNSAQFERKSFVVKEVEEDIGNPFCATDLRTRLPRPPAADPIADRRLAGGRHFVLLP